MSILPKGSTTFSIIEEQEQPSRTYKLDFKTKRIVTMTDGLEALAQAVYKILSTRRYAHLIYSSDYGFEPPFMLDEVTFRSEVVRRIREALLQDDRILDVVDFDIKIDEDSANVTCTVISKYGDFKITKEVDR
ncbi:DUF2634 domain-containing protein [Brevibacillus laterosporus]|uniref:DUF2634 domain-containing protein n=1 Tax=Brevibacillus laterosporus TaxID=1465 RepID=A0AAP3DIG2_BRELA|nr:DUF2634 domain-containing protein [Brevibacillus laterosporus]MCR8981578.1 DUF2634 domain-containing protein [Brevibacillus laterosporus]MCZ0808733.1 DUF2634 domain-containing protein [Brevibacillus laterosporus]MCZ0827294.1 DUF2634 domain-containing protein [Brevibacillus laterosporus]MCZ0851050.1 DUF2634 domain-containing protein [Brevibacillus laterosporus]